MLIEKNLTFQIAWSLKCSGVYSGSLLCRSDLLCRARQKEMNAYKGNGDIMKRNENLSKLALYYYWNINQHLIWGSLFIASVSVSPELLYCHWLFQSVLGRRTGEGSAKDYDALDWPELASTIQNFKWCQSRSGEGKRRHICTLCTARWGEGSSSTFPVQLWREGCVWLHTQQHCCPISAPLGQHRNESSAGAEVVCLPEPGDMA